MTNKYLEKVAVVAALAGALGAKDGDRAGGAVTGHLAGTALRNVAGGIALSASRGNLGAARSAAGLGEIVGGIIGGGAYSKLKKGVQGDQYHKKQAGLLSSRILGGAAVGAGVGAAGAGEGNRVSGALGGAALGAGAGALAGKLMAKKPKLLTDGKVHKMNNPQLFGADGNAINPRMLKAK